MGTRTRLWQQIDSVGAQVAGIKIEREVSIEISFLKKTLKADRVPDFSIRWEQVSVRFYFYFFLRCFGEPPVLCRWSNRSVFCGKTKRILMWFAMKLIFFFNSSLQSSMWSRACPNQYGVWLFIVSQYFTIESNLFHFYLHQFHGHSHMRANLLGCDPLRKKIIRWKPHNDDLSFAIFASQIWFGRK